VEQVQARGRGEARGGQDEDALPVLVPGVPGQELDGEGQGHRDHFHPQVEGGVVQAPQDGEPRAQEGQGQAPGEGAPGGFGSHRHLP